MKIDIVRDKKEDCAIGGMKIDGVFFGYTLEDKVREISGTPVEFWKVQNQTAIPAGTYEVGIDMSTRFGRPMPIVKNVPGFSGVRIHIGNTDENTEGCILIGLTCTENAIGRSTDAFKLFFPRLQAAIMAGQRVALTIR